MDQATRYGRFLTTVAPGRLVLVVGPSGAGKDTLIELARIACANDGKIIFPRRIVTREASSFEDNEYMDADKFRRLRDVGGFAVHWQAHGHLYGLPRAIDDEIRAGRTVVANVSRTVIGEMRQTYANVVVVLITAPPDILAERLGGRARRSDGAPEQRLRRQVNVADISSHITINNVGSAEEHGQELVRVISGD